VRHPPQHEPDTVRPAPTLKTRVHREPHVEEAAPPVPHRVESHDVSPRVRRRGVRMAVLALIGLAIIGTATAFGYRAYFVPSSASTGTPPVIMADNPVSNVVPAGTSESGKRPKNLRDLQGGVSLEQQPVEIRSALMAPQPVPSVSVSPPDKALQPSDGPKPIRTVRIRPDATDAAVSRAEPAAEPPVVPPGSYLVHLSSQKSEAEAQASFRSLQAKYPDQLGTRPLIVRRADLGDKGVYYRAMVGPFASSGEANQLCSQLKAAGGQCIIQRN
jgi:hypothetical protein